MTQRGLSETYEDVLREAVRIDEAERTLLKRFLSRDENRATQALFAPLTSFFADRSDGAFLGERKTEDLKALEAQITDEERKDEQKRATYAVATAQYPAEAFAHHLIAVHSLSRSQAEALAKLHVARDAQERDIRAGQSLKSVRAGIVAAVALLATQIPKDSFTALDWSDRAYGFYRLVLFGVLVAAIAYLALISIAARVMLRKSARQKLRTRWKTVGRLTELGLLHCALVQDFHAASSARQPDTELTSPRHVRAGHLDEHSDAL